MPGLFLSHLSSYITPPLLLLLLLLSSAIRPSSPVPSLHNLPKISTLERELLEREREGAKRTTRGARAPMATRRSALSHFFLLLAASIALLAATSEAISASGAGIIAGGAAELGWIPSRTACRGTIAECIAGDEFELDSEISRRILASSRYISYGALKRGSVPCSRRGVSYYNCRPGAHANPYSRGCSRITQCRS